MKTNVSEIGLGFAGLFLLVLTLSLTYAIFTGPSVASLGAVLGTILLFAACCVWLWHDTQRPQTVPLPSLVLLLRTPRTLTNDHIRQAVASALGVHCEDGDETAANYVIDTPLGFRVHVEGYEFSVNNFSRPYINRSQSTPETMPNLRLQQVIRDHHAGISVAVSHTPPYAATEASYQYIGRMIAALAAEDCIGLYSPETRQLNVWRTSLIDLLCGPTPLLAVTELVDVPAVRVTADDTHMQAAAREATSLWSAFVDAFEHRRPEQTFAVKVPFTDGEETEFMWVIVSAIDGRLVSGILDNEPITLTTVRAGDSVSIACDQVNDWLYTNGTEMIGGFTTHILAKKVA